MVGTTIGRFVLALLLLPACADAEEIDDAGERFPCGNNGGSCDLDTEVCVLGGDDMCSTCAPRPAACDGDATCGCLPPGTDPVYGDAQCNDAGTCEVVDDGLVLTCTDVEWGCA
jgi:hypothetical protein